MFASVACVPPASAPMVDEFWDIGIFAVFASVALFAPMDDEFLSSQTCLQAFCSFAQRLVKI